MDTEDVLSSSQEWGAELADLSDGQLVRVDSQDAWGEALDEEAARIGDELVAVAEADAAERRAGEQQHIGEPTADIPEGDDGLDKLLTELSSEASVGLPQPQPLEEAFWEEKSEGKIANTRVVLQSASEREEDSAVQAWIAHVSEDDDTLEHSALAPVAAHSSSSSFNERAVPKLSVKQEQQQQVAVSTQRESMLSSSVPSASAGHSEMTTTAAPTLPDRATGKRRLTAVELARQRAEDFANESLDVRQVTWNKKHRVDESSDGEQQTGAADDQPVSEEVTNSKKYKRRLQKNRDSAFVSRIRRRAYTKFLEESLLEQEAKKEQLQSRVEALTQEVEALKKMFQASAASAKTHALADRASTSFVRSMDSTVDIVRNSAGLTRALQRAFSPVSRNTMVAPVGASTMFIFVFLFGLMLPGMSPARRGGAAQPSAPAEVFYSPAHGHSLADAAVVELAQASAWAVADSSLQKAERKPADASLVYVPSLPEPQPSLLEFKLLSNDDADVAPETLIDEAPVSPVSGQAPRTLLVLLLSAAAEHYSFFPTAVEVMTRVRQRVRL